jgi:hypothetical protein
MLPGFPIPLLNRQLTLEASQSLPLMTSNSTPSGHVASATSVLADAAVFQPWKAFDGTNQAWYSTAAGRVPSYIARQVPSPILVGRYRMSGSSADGKGEPRDFTFEGFDGSSWIVLDTRTGVTGWSPSVFKDFDIAVPQSFAWFRVYITANNGDTNYTCIEEIQLLQIL